MKTKRLIATAICALASSVAGAFAFGLPATSDATFKNDVLSSSQPVVVDFFAPWCNPCRRMAPAVQGLSNQMQGRVKFVEVNIDENPRLTQLFRVSSVPTIVIFKNGRMVARTTGAMSMPQLATFVSHGTNERIAGSSGY